MRCINQQRSLRHLTNCSSQRNSYYFDPNGFNQSSKLARLVKKLDIPKTTFHGLPDTHASFLFSQDTDIAYVSKRLGYIPNDTELFS